MTVNGNPLVGQVALITGASAGPGRAIALALASAGAAVGLCDTNPDRLDQVTEVILAEGGHALAFTGDVSKRFFVSATLETLHDTFGGVTIVINAMRVDRRASLLDLDEYDWQRIIAINLGGAFQCTQLAARVMADEGGGVVVNVVTGTAQQADPDSAAFAVSQAGLIGFTQVAARALFPRGVRVYTLLLEDPDSPAAQSDAAQVVVGLCTPDAHEGVGSTLVVARRSVDDPEKPGFESG